jgi:P27 family predicted phage terminase small subunit
MSKLAKKYLKRIKPTLLRLNIARELDEESVWLLCQSYADFVKYKQILDDEGATVSDGRGGVKKHPATTLQKEAFNRFQTLADRFGLNPVARNRLDISPDIPDEDRKFEALLD